VYSQHKNVLLNTAKILQFISHVVMSVHSCAAMALDHINVSVT
jgi:hypothetical protein